MIAENTQKRLAKGARVIFDVGAERGRYASAYLEMFPEAQVYAFEPAPVAFSTLASLALVEPRIEAIPAAVLDKPGDVRLNIASADVYSSVLDLIPGWTEHKMVTEIAVQAITLDGFCAERGIKVVDVLKIDTQGTELAVLRGAVGLLTTGIRVILCELEYMDRYAGQCWHYEVIEFLARYGYQLTKAVEHHADGRLLRADGIFT